jgi:hypothetical protein
MSSVVAAIIADILGWSLALACLAIAVINVYTVTRDRRSPYAPSWIVQAVAALYACILFAQAAANHDRLSMLDGRLAVLVILLASIADRIVHARQCNGQ